MTPQQIWQSQASDAPRISLDYVRHITDNLERRTRRTNALSYAVGVIACAACAWAAWRHFTDTKPIMVAGVVCIALWLLYSVYVGHRLAATQSTPAEAGVLDTLHYHRRQLERQRDARRASLRRVYPAVLPGFALMLFSLFVEFGPVPWGSIGIVVAGFAISMGGGAWSIGREARRFQREIDALDSLAGGD